MSEVRETMPNEAHPLARWLRHVADNLDCIYVRRRDPNTGCWGDARLADLEVVEAAEQAAHWLCQNRIPVAVPRREDRQ